MRRHKCKYLLSGIKIGCDPILRLSCDIGIQWLQKIQMPAIHSPLLERITIDPEVRFGKPCIRGHRITVQEILEWLSSGASQQQILDDYPQLEPDDFLAVYAYVAELAAGRKISGG